MAIQYTDLEYRMLNGNKTVFNKLTNKGYSDPTALALDLGIKADLIDWSKISTAASPYGLFAPIVEKASSIIQPVVPKVEPAPPPNMSPYTPPSGELTDLEKKLKSTAFDLQSSSREAVAEFMKPFDETGMLRKSPTVTPATTLKPTPLSDPSIVNFLTSLKLPSDFISRSRLAKERGITGYTGSGPQNTRLLGMLRQEYGAGTFGQPQEPGAKPPKEEEPLKPPVEKKPEQLSPKDTQAEIDKLNQDANKNQQSEFSLIDEKAKGKVDLSTSTGLTQKLIELLGAEATRQASAPSLEQKFVAEREKLGIVTLETSLNKADADLKKLDADFASTIQEEEGRQVSMTQIRRRQGAVELAYNRQRRDLVAERDSIANQLNQKYGVLNSMVRFAGIDYDNAQQNYQFQWNAAMQMTNLIKGIEDSAKTDQERKIDNARANVQIMLNLFKEGNITYDKLDESSKLDIKNMEIQSGFPVGFTQFVNETVDDPVIHFGSTFTDTSGNRMQPVITVDKETGNIAVKNINLGKAKPGGDKEPPSSYQEWQLAGGLEGTGKTYAEFIATRSGLTEGETKRQAGSEVVAFFNAKKGKDGYVSPEIYKQAMAAWVAAGFSGKEFDEAYKNFANPKNYEDYSANLY